MKVYAKLFASLAKFADCRIMHEPMEVDLPENASLAELFDQIGIPPQEVKTAFVNSVIQAPDYTLSDGDDVGIFPPVGGGSGVGFAADSGVTHPSITMPSTALEDRDG
jgi:molybdopterin converting factor small subunit